MTECRNEREVVGFQAKKGLMEIGLNWHWEDQHRHDDLSRESDEAGGSQSRETTEAWQYLNESCCLRRPRRLSHLDTPRPCSPRP